jgi:beta-xylosidase
LQGILKEAKKRFFGIFLILFQEKSYQETVSKIFVRMKKQVYIVLFLTLLPLNVLAQSENKWGQWPSWGDQRNGTYLNPVIPADYSDMDCIRVGDDYYAISSTFQFSPGMTVLHSTDLVNWTICGHAVEDLTQISPALNWNRMDRYARGIWAGTIRYHKERFYIFFGTPDEGYFMTSAPKPEGPWEPLHPLLSEPGWDDCSVLWDDEGNACFVGTHFADKYKTYLFKMTPDGKTIDRSSAVQVNSVAGREANKLIKVDDWYYLIFSEYYPDKGRYVLAKRSKNLMGPYTEEKQLAYPSREAMEPNQGGIVNANDGNWYFLTHHGSGSWEGRAVSLLPVTWIKGWPVIGEVGNDGIGSMVWGGKIPVTGQPAKDYSTSDHFEEKEIAIHWQWNYQPRADMFSLKERPGWLRLKAFRPLAPGRMLTAGNTLSQRTFRSLKNTAVIRMDITEMTDGQQSGLCHFSKDYAAIEIVQTGNVRRLGYRQNENLILGEEVAAPFIWFKSEWGLDGKSQFSYSFDGQSFTAFGEVYQMKWGNYRGDRIGIFNFNDKDDSGVVDVDFFEYEVINLSK